MGRRSGPGSVEASFGTSTGNTSVAIRSLPRPREADFRPWGRDGKAPVRARAAEALEIDPVRPVHRCDLRQVDSPAVGVADIQERRAGEKPAYGRR
jgi:hypothetical protein